MKTATAEMPLSDIAQELGVNKSKLQYYKKLKLLKPVKAFKRSKQYTYDLNQVKKVLAQIDKDQAKGLTLLEIAQHANI